MVSNDDERPWESTWGPASDRDGRFALAGGGCLSGEGGDATIGDAGEKATLTSTTESSESSGASDDESDGSDGSDDDDGSTEEAATGTEATPNVDFGASVASIEKCGKTCRTLTYAVKNQGADAAPDVTVRIRIFTGGKKIWDRDQSVGTIDARSKRSGITRDIDVGLLGGQKIKSNDGDITIENTPRAAGVTETFTFERTLDV